MPASVEPFDDLEAVAQDAAGALDRPAQPCLFDRLDWFRLVQRHTPAGRLLVLRAQERERRAWLFLSVAGGAAQALANWYSLRFAVVGDARLGPALARALRKQGIGRIDLYPMVPGDPFADALRASGWLVRTGAASVTWRMATQGLNFENYWAQRPARLRNTAARKAKAAALQISIHTRFDPAAWEEYEAVYRASWKPSEGSPPFLRALAEIEGASGTLRLGIATLEGRPVAAQLWLVEGGIATIHKLAYAEDAKALSPGTILSQAMFRHALDGDRVAAIDFGLGDDAYKADWVEGRSPVERLVAYDLKSLRGLLSLGRAMAVKLVRPGRSG